MFFDAAWLFHREKRFRHKSNRNPLPQNIIKQLRVYGCWVLKMTVLPLNPASVLREIVSKRNVRE
jgi:hypothetical protein